MRYISKCCKQPIIKDIVTNKPFCSGLKGCGKWCEIEEYDNFSETEWEKKFDEEYGDSLYHKALGIVVASQMHIRNRPSGSDGSYLTNKLLKIFNEIKENK